MGLFVWRMGLVLRMLRSLLVVGFGVIDGVGWFCYIKMMVFCGV